MGDIFLWQAQLARSGRAVCPNPHYPRRPSLNRWNMSDFRAIGEIGATMKHVLESDPWEGMSAKPEIVLQPLWGNRGTGRSGYTVHRPLQHGREQDTEEPGARAGSIRTPTVSPSCPGPLLPCHCAEQQCHPGAEYPRESDADLPRPSSPVRRRSPGLPGGNRCRGSDNSSSPLSWRTGHSLDFIPPRPPPLVRMLSCNAGSDRFGREGDTQAWMTLGKEDLRPKSFG